MAAGEVGQPVLTIRLGGQVQGIVTRSGEGTGADRDPPSAR